VIFTVIFIIIAIVVLERNRWSCCVRLFAIARLLLDLVASLLRYYRLCRSCGVCTGVVRILVGIVAGLMSVGKK